MSGLYLVATPIGNLDDFSPRGVKTLKEVDFIVAEDTRVTIKLLHHFKIQARMYSYHQHNQQQRGEQIVKKLLDGKQCALVSDAGMPCISDPGEDLVQRCIALNIPVTVIPGANAAISALAVSGLSTYRFCFEGFLSTNRKNRIQHLAELKTESRTMIFYEAPHKLSATLRDFIHTFGADRPIVLVRELTKFYEEIIRTTLGQALEKMEERTLKGEFVLLIAGKRQPKQQEMSREEAIALAFDWLKQGEKPTDVAKKMAKQTFFSKAEIYQGLMAQHNKQNQTGEEKE